MTDCRTKFPIKALPQLKSLAANLQKIPLPMTIPPHIPKNKDKKKKAETAADDVIVID
jgi:hypothetical protein